MGGEQAAEASECADEQGFFWQYHDDLFVDARSYNAVDDFVGLFETYDNADVDAFRDCLENGKMIEEIGNDVNDARAYFVTGTPTFFINGVRLVGAQPLSAFETIIDDLLSQQ